MQRKLYSISTKNCRGIDMPFQFDVDLAYITISKDEYERLCNATFKLNCLIAGGVDNWEWYYESLKQGGYYDDDEEEE